MLWKRLSFVNKTKKNDLSEIGQCSSSGLQYSANEELWWHLYTVWLLVSGIDRENNQNWRMNSGKYKETFNLKNKSDKIEITFHCNLWYWPKANIQDACGVASWEVSDCLPFKPQTLDLSS